MGIYDLSEWMIDLNVEEIIGTCYEKNWKKQTKNNLE